MSATPLSNEDFNALVNELLARVENMEQLAETLRHYSTGTRERYEASYRDARALIADFRRFAEEMHRDRVDQLTTSELGRIEGDLDNMMKLNEKPQSKHHTPKNDYLKSALSGLRQDIRSMKE